MIVNYNGGSMLLDCVQSAVREGVPAEQVFIIDNGSCDESIQTVESQLPAVSVIRNACNAGFARAMNQGMAQASSDFILLLNNDASLEPGALRAFAESFDALPNVAIAGGQLRFPDGRLQNAFAPLPSLIEEILPLVLLKWLQPDRFRRKALADAPMAVESVLGACICVRRSALPRLGLLDEDFFFFFEEIDWCRRAWVMGAEVFHVPQARAIHRQGHTANRFRGPARVEYQRSKLTYFKKTRKGAGFAVLSAVLVTRTLVNALAGVVMCAATLCLDRRLRLNTRTYWYLLCWHALGRPKSWGLPGKCPSGSGEL